MTVINYYLLNLFNTFIVQNFIYIIAINEIEKFFILKI